MIAIELQNNTYQILEGWFDKRQGKAQWVLQNRLVVLRQRNCNIYIILIVDNSCLNIQLILGFKLNDYFTSVLKHLLISIGLVRISTNRLNIHSWLILKG